MSIRPKKGNAVRTRGVFVNYLGHPFLWLAEVPQILLTGPRMAAATGGATDTDAEGPWVPRALPAELDIAGSDGARREGFLYSLAGRLGEHGISRARWLADQCMVGQPAREFQVHLDEDGSLLSWSAPAS